MPERVPAGQKSLPGVRGAQQNVPDVQPGGARKENREAERFGKAGRLNGAQRFKAAGRFEPGAPLREVCVHTKKQLCGGCETGESKDKSINADSGVGNKGVKADPRRTAKAAGFTILHLPPPGGIRAGRPRPTRQVQQGAVPPLVVPAPEGYIWVERPCYLLQSPLFRQQQVPMPHGRGWVSTPAECREPRAASRPRPDSPGRKNGAPWKIDRTIASRRVQSAYLPARKFGRGGPAEGRSPSALSQGCGGACIPV